VATAADITTRQKTSVNGRTMQNDGAADEMSLCHVLNHQDAARHRLGTLRTPLHVNAMLRVEVIAERRPTAKIL